MTIKKGIITAAGRGTRFLPVTKAYPKELVPLIAKPNIQLLVEELIAAGINRIAIVHRPGENRLKEYFQPDKKLENFLKENNKEYFIESLRRIWQKATIEFIPQTDDLPYGNASPVLAAKKFIDNDPFVYMYGDDLVIEEKTGQFLSKIIKLYEENKVNAVGATSQVAWEEISRYSSIKYKDPTHKIKIDKVHEKLPRSEAPSNTTLFGRFAVSPIIFSCLEKQKTSQGELWFTDAINCLAERGTVLVCPIEENGQWLTTGDPLRWLKANITIGLRDKTIAQDLKTFLEEALKE